MSDFLSQMQSVEDALKGAARDIKSKFDSWTFKMLIGCLKSEDAAAVGVAIDQLVKEKREISIPPLFVVSKAHPIPTVRVKAANAIEELDAGHEVPGLTAEKSVEEAALALVERFGNFKEI